MPVLTGRDTHSVGHPGTGSQLAPSPAPEQTLASPAPQDVGTASDMRTVFLVLLLWAVACAHPVPGHGPARPSAQQEDAASEGYINKLGGGDGRYPPPSAERGDNTLTGDLAGGNAVVEEHGGQDKGSNVGEAQHLNWVDHKDMSARHGNSLGFLEGDARDDGDNEAHRGTGVNGLPFRDGGLLDEEDESGDDTFEENGEEAEGEGPTYVAGADGEGEHGYDRGDAGAGGRHGDSSSSSSESVGVEHRRYRNYERTYRWGGGSSSSQEEEEEEERYNFEDEAMQGDDPSVFDGPGSSYKGHRAGHRAARSSRESGRGVGSHHWEEGDSQSPEVGDTDSEDDSPSVEDNSQSEEVVASPSEEDSSSRSREDGDSPSREDEDSKSQEDTANQSDEESPEDNSQEVVSTSRSREVQEDQESAEDRSAPSTPDSESREDEGNQSKSREDDGDQSQSPEDSVEDSKEDENDSDSHGDVPSTSAESQSASPEDATSQEDNAGEDSSSPESNDSESQEDDDEEESHSQEDATRESSSHGDDSSPQSLESGSRRRRLGAYRNKPAADYDDNDCQDGY